MNDINELNDEGRRAKLKELLFSLAEREDVLKSEKDRLKVYRELEKIYYITNEKRFRHFYSDIFSVLTQIIKDEKGNIDVLGSNIRFIKDNYVAEDSNCDVSDEIKKLFDHISLDIARIRYSDAEYRKQIGEEDKDHLQSQVNSLAAQAIQLNKSIEAAEDKLQNVQKDYIAILGIFSAIVIAFVGEMTFSTSVLNNIHQIPNLFYAVAIIATVGLAFFDILIAMFNFVFSMVRDRNFITFEYWKNINLWCGLAILLLLILPHASEILSCLRNICSSE